ALLGRALDATVLHGIEVNVGMLRAAVDECDVRTAKHNTSTLACVADPRPRITVERAGLLTTVQDLPGRIGMWDVGVPPSGPMDDLSFRLGNRALGNPQSAAGLECTRGGPALRFPDGARVCITGAPVSVTLNGAPVPQWQSITIPADGALDIAPMTGPGMRCYVLVAGGLQESEY